MDCAEVLLLAGLEQQLKDELGCSSNGAQGRKAGSTKAGDTGQQQQCGQQHAAGLQEAVCLQRCVLV
jgi:hypothetical protein